MSDYNQSEPLFQPLDLGALELPGRVLMAPLTRSRSSQPGDIPNDMNAEYYRQRAGAGLIISEATQDAPLNDWDSSTFYGGDEHGYIDYPTLDEARKRSA